MLLRLFAPDNKVQKDTNITGEIDRELASFGRTSLLVTCIGFGLYLWLGSFRIANPQLTLVLSLGLSLLVIVKGYLLVGFDNLHPRGAARWREQYLLVTLAESVWLTSALCSITLVVGVAIESLAIWFIVAVYAFTATGVFAPYNRFCQGFVSIIFIPGILSLLGLFGAESLLFATTLFVMFAALISQTRKYSESFWQSKEANFLLQQKMVTLQAQKKNDVAKIELNYEFIANLGQELKTALNDILAGLTLIRDSKLDENQSELVNLCEKASERQVELVDNIVDFAKISKKTLVIEHNTFGLRKDLEDTFAELCEQAHDYNVELNYVIAPDLPYQAKGDAIRIKQVITALVSNMIRFSEKGEVFIDVRAEQQHGSRYMLLVNIYDEGQGNLSRENGDLFNAFSNIKQTKAGTGLGLAICKGIAECMEGEIGVSGKAGRGDHYWLQLPVDIKSPNSHYFVPNMKLEGAKLLVVAAPAKIQSHLLKELTSWGLAVSSVEGYREAKAMLLEANASNQPYRAMLGFTTLQDNSIVNTFQRIAQSTELGELHQFVLASQLQFQQQNWSKIIEAYPHITAVKKPLNYKVFHQLLVQRILKLDFSLKQRVNHQKTIDKNNSPNCKILLVEDHRVNQMVAEGMLKKLGYQARLAKNGLEALDLIEKEKFDLVLMDCQMAEMDGYEATQHIRYREQHSNEHNHIPIIALTAHTAEEDQSRCLAAGMDDYLPKPVRYNELESRLRRWLGEQDAMRHH